MWRRLAVIDGRGSGELALQLSRDWSVPQPDIVRAVITIHGEHRDARAYGRIASDALATAGASGRGTLLVTPRFPAGGPPSLLRWPGAGWIDGQAASAPAALSSFEAMDALIDRLADRARFPSLRSIVLVGHSAGAQFMQRYAVLGRGEARAALAGIAMRHVIANPSSYAYFAASASSGPTAARWRIAGNTGWRRCRPTRQALGPTRWNAPTCNATSPTCSAVSTTIPRCAPWTEWP